MVYVPTGKLQGREIENMKRLFKTLPAFREKYTDPETGEKKSRLAIEIDWKEVDLDGDWAITKWEFRTSMDRILS